MKCCILDRSFSKLKVAEHKQQDTLWDEDYKKDDLKVFRVKEKMLYSGPGETEYYLSRILMQIDFVLWHIK